MKKKERNKMNTLVCAHNGKLRGAVLPLQTARGRERATSSVLFHSSLCFFYRCRKTNHEPLAVSVRTQTRTHTHMPTCYKRLYSQSDVPQVQAVFRHLALSEPHRLQLEDGEQLLSWVDDLTLQGMKTLRFMPCEIWQ